VPDGSEVYCKNVILPSKVYDQDVEPIIYLRNKLRHSSSDLDSKIYISRSLRRKISNENSLRVVLQKRGFRIVKCEIMSFDEQAKLFSTASVIIGPHGAGMTNVLFAKNNAKILEMRNQTYHGNCYLLLCNKLGFNYYNLYGKGHRVQKFEKSDTELLADIEVDLGDLTHTLDMMGV
ncbi:MAG: glycosyltransferase family 61 protein, partial [Methanomassiliicoccales archaeon]